MDLFAFIHEMMHVDLSLSAAEEEQVAEWLDEWLRDVAREEAIATAMNTAKKRLADDPDDIIGKGALLKVLYDATLPELKWDKARLAEIAKASVPFVELIERTMPDAKIHAEVDEWSRTHGVIRIITPSGDPVSFREENERKVVSDVLLKCDEFEFHALLDERIEITLVFYDVLIPYS